jgi:superfamily II DNA or RNA helicase
MIIAVDSKTRIPLSDLPPSLLEWTKSRLTFVNPAYGEAVGRLKAQGKDYKPYGIPQYITGWQETKTELLLPRGCSGEVIGVFKPDKIINRTRKLPPVDFEFLGQLKPAQILATQAILGRHFGTISSPTGSGKTVMGLYCVSQRRQPALVVVHTTNLLRQWVERASQFLGIPEEEIGIIGDRRKTIGKRLTVGLVQTLRKCSQEIAPHIGFLVVDECHHTPATTFTKTVLPFDCAYSLGLSATHKRRDGLTPLIYWYIGPLVYEVGRNILLSEGDIVKVDPIIRETSFRANPEIDPTWQRAALIKQLTEDLPRNSMIAADVCLEAKTGACIVLTDRKEHAERLTMMLLELGVQAESCHGDVVKPAQEGMIKALNDGRLQVLVATGQLLGEGFDCKRLSALFLATPIKFGGRLIQYLGRVARADQGKSQARVYDYHDIEVDVLMKAARERLRTYKKLAREEK